MSIQVSSSGSPAATSLLHGWRRADASRLITHEPGVAPAGNSDIEAAMVHDAQEAEVQQALALLTPRDRAVLLLWDAGWSYAEIAAQTHLAISAVGTTLVRARKRLVEAHDSIAAERRAPLILPGTASPSLHPSLVGRSARLPSVANPMFAQP